jgi:hypothetical protein
MSTKSKPYVMVTGAASVDDALGVLALFRKAGYTMDNGHMPAMGFQSSWRSLDMGFSKDNIRVPKLRELPKILDTVKGQVFTTVHYYTKNPDRLVTEVSKLLNYDDMYRSGLIGGLQINKMCPSPEQMSFLRERHPDIKITIQVPDNLDSNPKEIERLVKNYKIDYILLDSSYGTGKEFVIDQMASTYKALRNGGYENGIVGAGGIDGHNARRKASHLFYSTGTKDVSLDAEGGLRNKLSEGYDNDVLNLDSVNGYLMGAAGAIGIRQVNGNRANYK